MSPRATKQPGEVADHQVLDHVGDDELLGDGRERRHVGASSSTIPAPNESWRQTLTGAPRTASVCARFAYATATTISSSGASGVDQRVHSRNASDGAARRRSAQSQLIRLKKRCRTSTAIAIIASAIQ